MADRKKKITLTVDAATVDQAKRIGINMSELTERVLRGFAFNPKNESRPALLEHYKAMFDAMLPVLKDYNTSVRVAEYWEHPKGFQPFQETVSLLEDGSFWVGEQEVAVSFDQVRDVDFLAPDAILKNFLDALEKAKGKRREDLKSLEIYRRIIEAIVRTEVEDVEPAARGTKRLRKRVGTGRSG